MLMPWRFGARDGPALGLEGKPHGAGPGRHGPEDARRRRWRDCAAARNAGDPWMCACLFPEFIDRGGFD
jgi:hypothetical protein